MWHSKHNAIQQRSIKSPFQVDYQIIYDESEEPNLFKAVLQKRTDGGDWLIIGKYPYVNCKRPDKSCLKVEDAKSAMEAAEIDLGRPLNNWIEQ